MSTGMLMGGGMDAGKIVAAVICDDDLAYKGGV